MDLTDIDEKEIIKKWAEEQSDNNMYDKYLPRIDKNIESYWCKYNSSEDIKEYNFNNIPEFLEILTSELEEDFYKDLLLTLAVATFKERKILVTMDVETDKANKTQKNNFEIPGFIYAF